MEFFNGNYNFTWTKLFSKQYVWHGYSLEKKMYIDKKTRRIYTKIIMVVIFECWYG